MVATTFRRPIEPAMAKQDVENQADHETTQRLDRELLNGLVEETRPHIAARHAVARGTPATGVLARVALRQARTTRLVVERREERDTLIEMEPLGKRMGAREHIGTVLFDPSSLNVEPAVIDAVLGRKRR
jgi:hypothetical protein